MQSLDPLPRGKTTNIPPHRPLHRVKSQYLCSHPEVPSACNMNKAVQGMMATCKEALSLFCSAAPVPTQEGTAALPYPCRVTSWLLTEAQLCGEQGKQGRRQEKFLGGLHKANQAESFAYDPAPLTPARQLLHCRNVWSIFPPCSWRHNAGSWVFK